MRQQYRDQGVWSHHIIRSRYFGAYMRAPYSYGIRLHIETVPRTSFQLPYIVQPANLTRLPIWRSSIFKRRQIYRTTPSYSYLSSGSVTIQSLHIRNGGTTEQPLSYLVNIYTEQNRIQVVVLVEFSRIQQNLAEYSRFPLDCRLIVGLQLLGQQKQIDVYKVLQRCFITVPPF